MSSVKEQGTQKPRAGEEGKIRYLQKHARWRDALISCLGRCSILPGSEAKEKFVQENYRKLGVGRVQLHGVWEAAQSKLGRLMPRGRIQSLSSVTSGVLRAKRLTQTRIP